MEYAEKQLIKVDQPSLMLQARESLTGKVGLVVAAMLIYGVISIVVSLIPGGLGSFIIGAPLALGMAGFYLKIARNQDAEIADLFEGFKNYGAAFVTYLLLGFGVVIGLLFLIVPGIMLALGWSQAFYIINDEPEINGVDALKKSWHMMDGRKMDLLILCLRFFPWFLLCLLTLGIGFLYVGPWAYTTFAKYYDHISGNVGSGEMEIIDHLIE